MEMRKLKRIGVVILVLALVLLIFSNRGEVPIHFLFGFHMNISLILLMVGNVLIGFALGIYVARNIGNKVKSDSSPSQPTDSNAAKTS